MENVDELNTINTQNGNGSDELTNKLRNMEMRIISAGHQLNSIEEHSAKEAWFLGKETREICDEWYEIFNGYHGNVLDDDDAHDLRVVISQFILMVRNVERGLSDSGKEDIRQELEDWYATLSD